MTHLPPGRDVIIESSLKHIDKKNKLARSNFAALKNCIMLNVSITKTEQNNYEVLSPVLSSLVKFSQNYAKMSKMNKMSEDFT